ncbi:MAG TPA: glycosyltransferase family 2 protein [Candidatus Saccharimonadales bacterium]|jgi:glycosyltransferase involved in cell wall biosynthesis|nr:glycosyltransferase family 2 protein [Candidatus Saccharimonadales bacterium]
MPNKNPRNNTEHSSKPLLSILVPVYNEEATIKEIIEKITSLPIKNYEVLIVDDKSKDKSKEIIEKFSQKFNKPNVKLKILTHDKNSGKGAGIKSGLELAKGEYFIIQDADLEYDPADIPDLLKSAIEDDHTVVYGSRFMGKIQGMPLANNYANRLYNFLLRRLYNTSITDMHTCYKLVNTKLMLDLEMSSEGFDYATELISKLLRRSVAIHEVPINYNGRSKKEGKKIGVKDGIDCAYMILKYRFGKST